MDQVRAQMRRQRQLSRGQQLIYDITFEKKKDQSTTICITEY